MVERWRLGEEDGSANTELDLVVVQIWRLGQVEAWAYSRFDQFPIACSQYGEVERGSLTLPCPFFVCNRFQITKKLQSAGKRSQLDPDEKDLVEGPLKALVEEGPMHSPQHGIFQWQIKSLKKQLANKCVFWSNTEDHLPNGSVADGTRYSSPML